MTQSRQGNKNQNRQQNKDQNRQQNKNQNKQEKNYQSRQQSRQENKNQNNTENNGGNGLKNGMTPEEYNSYVKQVTPVNNTAKDVLRAFLMGGTICVAGQCINSWLTGTMELGKEDAAAWTSIILVAISVVLTGFNLYSKLVKWGGAGALVPITGFANSVASPAIESQVEGQVFGIGCSIFKIAGPVILYGVFASWVLGVIYWILKLPGIVG